MKHGLTILTLDKRPFVEITAEEFREIKMAQANLMTALAIEEKFEILVENYSEYEQSLLNLTLRKMLRQDFEVTAFASDRQSINRRTANVLMAARLYIDQAQHDFTAMYGSNSVEVASLKAAFSREYDQALGYRVMEAVRNYVQHRSLPVGTLSYPGDWHDEDGNACIRFRIEPQLDIDGIRNDSDFKPSVLLEIEKEPSAKDLTLMLRHYVAGLSRVHLSTRDTTAKSVDAWVTTVARAIERARTDIKDRNCLAAVQADDGHYCEEVHLVGDILKRFQEMRKRYCNLGLLSGWYVSSRSSCAVSSAETQAVPGV